MNDENLQDILSGDDPTVSEQQVEQSTGEQQTAPPAEEDIPQGQPQEVDLKAEFEAYKAELDKKITGLISAKTAETRRRQEAEAQLTHMQQKQEFYDDPESYVAAEVSKAVQVMDNRLLNLSEQNAAYRYDDFQGMKESFFNEVAPENPALIQQFLQTPDPYESLYQYMKKINLQKELGDVNDLESLKAKLREELKQEMMGNDDALRKAEIEAEIRNKLPGTLSNARATGGNTSTGVPHESLEEIFNR